MSDRRTSIRCGIGAKSPRSLIRKAATQRQIDAARTTEQPFNQISTPTVRVGAGPNTRGTTPLKIEYRLFELSEPHHFDGTKDSIVRLDTDRHQVMAGVGFLGCGPLRAPLRGGSPSRFRLFHSGLAKSPRLGKTCRTKHVSPRNNTAIIVFAWVQIEVFSQSGASERPGRRNGASRCQQP